MSWHMAASYDSKSDLFLNNLAGSCKNLCDLSPTAAFLTGK